ncbi:MAG: Mpo1-like protein [Steroidobacteraceae bacterium]
MRRMSFRNFEEFYPFYLGEHADRTSRRLHVIGTSAAVLQILAAIVLREPMLCLTALLSGYGFAWVGHYVFEKNRPATFKHPLYSLRGDFRMAREVFSGRIPW